MVVCVVEGAGVVGTALPGVRVQGFAESKKTSSILMSPW